MKIDSYEEEMITLSLEKRQAEFEIVIDRLNQDIFADKNLDCRVGKYSAYLEIVHNLKGSTRNDLMKISGAMFSIVTVSEVDNEDADVFNKTDDCYNGIPT